MLGKPPLEIEVDELLKERPLLPSATVAKLYDRYLQITSTDISEWMSKTLAKEKDVRTLFGIHHMLIIYAPHMRSGLVQLGGSGA